MELERECEKCGRRVQTRRFCSKCRSTKYRENNPGYHREYKGVQ
jgi:RNA polymerase subunit RPABC4/transcription elongation factor Spt4